MPQWEICIAEWYTVTAQNSQTSEYERLVCLKDMTFIYPAGSRGLDAIWYALDREPISNRKELRKFEAELYARDPVATRTRAEAFKKLLREGWEPFQTAGGARPTEGGAMYFRRVYLPAHDAGA